MDDETRYTVNDGYPWDVVNDILSSIDDLICDGDFGKHSHSLTSTIKPNHHNDIELKPEPNIISVLQKSDRDERQSTFQAPYAGDGRPQSEFFKAKTELFLGVHGLVGCQDRRQNLGDRAPYLRTQPTLDICLAPKFSSTNPVAP